MSCICVDTLNTGLSVNYVNSVISFNALVANTGLYTIKLFSSWPIPFQAESTQQQIAGTALAFNLPALPSPANIICQVFDGNGVQLNFTQGLDSFDCIVIRSVVDSTLPASVLTGLGVAGFAPVPNTGICGDVVVCDVTNFPAPDNTGLITLDLGVAYHVVGIVDITPYRIFAPENGTLCAMIKGSSSETSKLVSTLGNSEALISGNGRFPCQNISFEVMPANLGDIPIVFNFDCLPFQSIAALDWYGVNVDNSNIGIFRNFGNLVLINCAMIGNTEGFLIGGTVDSIVFFSTIFRNTTTGGTLIKLEPNTVINRRFRFAFAPMVVPIGSFGIDMPLTVTMPTDSYQVTYAAFSGGGNYVTGIDSQDNRADFSQNSGISNTRYTLDAGFEDSAVATIVGAGNQNVYLPIGGISVLNSLSGKFVQIGNNSYEYTGAVNQSFLISCNATFTSASNNQIAFKIAKNGLVLGTRGRGTANAANRAENVFTQVVVELQQGDLIQVFGANLTNTGNFTVVDLSFIAILS